MTENRLRKQPSSDSHTSSSLQKDKKQDSAMLASTQNVYTETALISEGNDNQLLQHQQQQFQSQYLQDQLFPRSMPRKFFNGTNKGGLTFGTASKGGQNTTFKKTLRAETQQSEGEISNLVHQNRLFDEEHPQQLDTNNDFQGILIHQKKISCSKEDEQNLHVKSHPKISGIQHKQNDSLLSLDDDESTRQKPSKQLQPSLHEEVVLSHPLEIKQKQRGDFTKLLFTRQQNLENAEEAAKVAKIQFKQANTIYQSNAARLWSIVRRDVFYPIKFTGKVETGLEKKRESKFSGSHNEVEKAHRKDALIQKIPDEQLLPLGYGLFIHPHSTFKQGWDMFTGLTQLYFPIMMPLRIAFDIDEHDYLLLDLLLESVFLLDMCFTCITGLIKGGELITDRIQISIVYFRNAFLWDVAMLVPYYLFEMSLGYIKIFRLARYWDRFLFFLNKTVYFFFKGGSSHKFAVLFYYLFKVSTLILLCMHVLTCFWIQVGRNADAGVDYDLTPKKFFHDGWVNDYFTGNPLEERVGVINTSVYISGYYFITTTIATVGYGDIVPLTVSERLYAMFCEFFGIALFGYISGGLVSAVKMSLLVGTLKKSESKNEFEQWLYEREKNHVEPLDKMLHKRIRSVYEFNQLYNFSDFFHETEYFHHLPKEQKRRLFNLLFTDIASFFGAFFRNITDLGMIQDIFAFMHPLTFLPGGEVIKRASLSRGIYFIVHGKVYLTTQDGEGDEDEVDGKRKIGTEEEHLDAMQQQKKSNKLKITSDSRHDQKLHFRKLTSGSFFGEFCLLGKSSAFTFQAAGDQPLFTLFISKSKFFDICSKYKETFSWLKQFAYYRFKYFNMVRIQKLSNLTKELEEGVEKNVYTSEFIKKLT